MTSPSTSYQRPVIDEGRRQIPLESLVTDPVGWPNMLGPWAQSPASLHACFAASGTVPHVVIDNFFNEDVARELRDAFPGPDSSIWHRYDNPLERKRACSDTSRMPPALREAVCALCSPAMVAAVRAMTGAPETEALQADPYCHGGGLHSHGRGEHLDLHLDYSLHPLSGLERRFNLIVYLVDEPWRPEYGGALELRGAAPDSAGSLPGERIASVLPAFNRAILFSTTAPSFHGFPSPLACPPEARRNSIALYYLTPPREGAPTRSKALYVPTPGALDTPELARLREIRAERRLCPEDVAPVLGHTVVRVST